MALQVPSGFLSPREKPRVPRAETRAGAAAKARERRVEARMMKQEELVVRARVDQNEEGKNKKKVVQKGRASYD